VEELTNSGILLDTCPGVDSASCLGSGRPAKCPAHLRGGETRGGRAIPSAESSAASLLGSNQHSALFWNRGGARNGLRVNQKLSGTWSGGDSVARRRGGQLCWLRQPGSGCNSDFGWNFLHISSHRPSFDGEMAIDRPHRSDRVRRCSQLLPGDQTSAIRAVYSPPACHLSTQSLYHLRVPKYFLTPIVLYLPQGPLLPRSAGPRYLSRAPRRSKRKCCVTRNSNPLAI
jgi:hypothetical protein